MLENELDKINEQIPDEEIKIAVSLAGLGKRSIAAVIDIGILLMLSFILMIYIVQPIYKKNTDINDYVNKQNEFKIASKLFYEDEETKKIKSMGKENYMSAAQAYFEQYCVSSEEEIACSIIDKTFAEAVLTEEWFKDYYSVNIDGELVYNNEKISVKADVEEYVYNYALTQFSKSDVYRELTEKTDYILSVQVFISVTAMLVVLYLVIPLIFKDGKTLGKQFFKISLANAGGYKVSKSQIFIRFTAYYLVNFILGLYISYFISVFISFTCMVFTKKQAAIHDFCAATIVIDDTSSIIYNTRNEHLEAIKLEEDSRNKVLFKRQLLKKEQDEK